MFTVNKLVFFLYIPVGLAPRTEMVKHTRLPFIVVLPITTLTSSVGVKCGAGLIFRLLEFIFLGILRIFKDLFRLISQFYSFLCTIDKFSFLSICQSIPSFYSRFNIRNYPSIIFSGNLPGGVCKGGNITGQTCNFKDIFEVPETREEL